MNHQDTKFYNIDDHRNKKRFREFCCMISFIFLTTLVLIIIILIFIILNSKVTPVKWEHKGMTFTNGKYCPDVRFGTKESDLSLDNLAKTGSTWVAIVVTQFQKDINSTEIKSMYLTATGKLFTDC